MALSFAKKKPTGAPVDEPEVSAKKAEAKETHTEAPAKMSWMKTGSSAKAAVAYEETKAEERKAEQGKMFRYRLKPGEDGSITFLDGKLDEDKMLELPRFYEHTVRMDGGWKNFVCTSEEDPSQPCPICEKGDKPSLVGVLTVIDHGEYTIKNGPNAGKKIINDRKLFVCKHGTIALLAKLIEKRGGNLAGCQFDVSRSDEKKPACGDAFDFQHRFGKLSELAAKCELKLEDVQPADYGEEITYRSPEMLIELGIGKAQTGVGYEKGASKLKDEL